MSTLPPEPISQHLHQVIDHSLRELALPTGVRRSLAAGELDAGVSRPPGAWIVSDRRLTAQLIQWSNSAFFNLSDKFSSLEEVHAVLGPQKMTRLALLIGVRSLYLPNVRYDFYAREQLWRHSIAVGAVASLVARTCEAADDTAAFMAGALHDIGLLASEKTHPENFRQMLTGLDALTDTAVTERRLWGWDHQTLGAELLLRWGFPPIYCDVARYHHQPHLACDAADEGLVNCVIVADFLCSRCGWTDLGLHNIAQPPDAVYSKLGIDASALAILWQQLYATLEQTRVFI